MYISDTLKGLPIKYLKITAVGTSVSLFLAYHIAQTCKAIRKIVNPSVLDRDTHQPEYIYVDDPMYHLTVKLEKDKETHQTLGFARIWKSLKYSLAWKLLWLCRHGNKDQRNIAIEQLAAFKNNKSWDCCKLAQALDMHTAVLLARTRGADLRYFLPPPIHIRRAAMSPNLLSYKLRDLVISVQNKNPHYCIQHFINKYLTIQEPALEALEADSVPIKPDRIDERDLCILCLDALYHHFNLFHVSKIEEDLSMLLDMGLLSTLAEALLRNQGDNDFDFAILKILTLLSVHHELLKDFFQNGIIRELSRLLRSDDVRLSSSAAVCLANLSGEHCYRPGLYLLHPLYRTTVPPICDTLLVHGLRGGVFVTWRQRDKKCAEPIGLIESMSDLHTNPPNENGNVKASGNGLEPNLHEVIEVLLENNDKALLAGLDDVAVPIETISETSPNQIYAVHQKQKPILEEQGEKNIYSYCWPKDWLPRECSNLRILGINYWSSLSEWLEWCPLQSADISTRAADMVPALVDAGVGTKSTSVVWLAHSMGGLIVKQALIDAAQSSEQHLRKLSENTKAVLFFSTPHRGSSLATMPRAAAAVLWPSSDVRQLQINSPTLLTLQKEFVKYANIYNWETISFAEALPTLVSAFKVPIRFVESYSADLGRGVFYELPLDHLTICKPATRQSLVYTTVLDVVKRASTEEVKIEYSLVRHVVDTLYTVKLKTSDILHILEKNKKSEGLQSGIRSDS